jgi:hypothetical protein
LVPLSPSLSRHHTFVRYKATYPLLAANYLGCKAYCREDRAIPGPFFEAVPITHSPTSPLSIFFFTSFLLPCQPTHRPSTSPPWPRGPTHFTRPNTPARDPCSWVDAPLLAARHWLQTTEPNPCPHLCCLCFVPHSCLPKILPQRPASFLRTMKRKHRCPELSTRPPLRCEPFGEDPLRLLFVLSSPRPRLATIGHAR